MERESCSDRGTHGEQNLRQHTCKERYWRPNDSIGELWTEDSLELKDQ